MIEFKGIITEKKICKICDRPRNNGIIIKGYKICEKCVQSIVNSNVNTKNYSLLVEKIRSIVIKEL